MPVNLVAPLAADLLPVPGIEIGTTSAGVRKANRKDVTVFKLAVGSSVGAVFTQNRFCAAPAGAGSTTTQHLAASAAAASSGEPQVVNVHTETDLA